MKEFELLRKIERVEAAQNVAQAILEETGTAYNGEAFVQVNSEILRIKSILKERMSDGVIHTHLGVEMDVVSFIGGVVPGGEQIIR